MLRCTMITLKRIRSRISLPLATLAHKKGLQYGADNDPWWRGTQSLADGQVGIP
jgi:hypothetical protein